MALPSGNVIPLNPASNNQGLLPDLCAQLNLLTEEYIHPLTSSLFAHLLSQLDEYLETASNNQDIMRLMDCRNSLKKNATAIEKRLHSQLVTVLSKAGTDNPEAEMTLSLLDNDDLNHKLVWASAAEKMRTEDNLQLLFRNKNRFEQAFPDHQDPMPASPEKLCSSFSNALTILEPDLDLEQKLLDWFIVHIQAEADKLWLEVDQLLNEAGIADIEEKQKEATDTAFEPVSQPGIHGSATGGYLSGASVQGASAQNGEKGGALSEPALSELTDIMNPQLMDSLAEKLVLRVEDMLVQDEIIPEAKMGRIRSIDLAAILNSLQLEVTSQHLSIINLAESVQSALETHEGHHKLSRRHEDLISIVGLLFEYILDDHQLPEAIKKEIALLQIPILKLAIFDPEFINDRAHPARMLLNEMTSAGMSCHEHLSFTAPVLPLILPLIESTVRTIITESQDDLTVFKRSLDNFRFEMTLIRQPEGAEHKEAACLTEEEEPDVAQPALPDLPEENEPEVEFSLDDAELADAGYEEEIVLESRSEELSAMLPAVTEDTVTDEEELPLPEQDPLASLANFIPVDGVRPGQWVEFVGEGESHRMRCKLARINKETDRYIFENRSGMRIAEYTGRQLQKDIDQGIIHVLEDNMIFDRALQAVMEKFKKK